MALRRYTNQIIIIIIIIIIIVKRIAFGLKS